MLSPVSPLCKHHFPEDKGRPQSAVLNSHGRHPPPSNHRYLPFSAFVPIIALAVLAVLATPTPPRSSRASYTYSATPYGDRAVTVRWFSAPETRRAQQLISPLRLYFPFCGRPIYTYPIDEGSDSLTFTIYSPFSQLPSGGSVFV